MQETVSRAPESDVRLRALGVGEIFDRAVTLYVRNVVPFIILTAFVAVPMALSQFFLSSYNSESWQQILAQAQAGKNAAPPVSPPNLLAFVPLLLAVCLQPFMYVAVAALVGRLYRGEPADWRACCGVALRHAGGIVMAVLCAIGIFAAAAIAAVMIVFFAALMTGLLVRAFLPLGLIAALITLAVFLAAGLCFLLVSLSISLAINAIGIEEAPFGRALGEGFARVFSGPEFRKASLVALSLAAVQLGASMLSAAVQGFSELLFHVPALDAAFTGLLVLVTGGFYGAILAVYYFDVRVRREGLDLQAALETMQTQPAP